MTKRFRPGLELALIYGLTLGASAIYSTLSLLRKLLSEAGVAGSKVTLNQSLSPLPWLDLAYQVVGLVLALVPVGLAIYLVSLNPGNPWVQLGLSRRRWLPDFGLGNTFAAAIGIPGIGLYLVGRQLGLAAQVDPSGLFAHWWTIPVLVLAAIKASIVEEVIAVAFSRLRMAALGWKPWMFILASALLRASYHSYQGYIGFVGNFVMGLAFAWFFQRTGRLLPLLVAHAAMDIAVFVAGPWFLSMVGFL